jgi:excisionase family DNA binding protein
MLALTIEEARARVKLSRSAFYKLLKDGTVPAKKCGSRTLIPVSDFEQWFANLPNKSPPPKTQHPELPQVPRKQGRPPKNPKAQQEQSITPAA